MATYISRRALQALLVIIIVSISVFLVMRFLPGDPVMLYIGFEEFHSITPERIEEVRHELGLDKSLPAQYYDWVVDIFHGDLGTSYSYRDPVWDIFARRLPVTIHLGIISFVLSHLMGVLLGITSAIRRGKITDTLVTILANIGITIPIFWLGILMIYAFGLKLSWLPLLGYTSPFEDFWMSTKQLIMPVICLAVFPLGAIARQTRSSMLEVIKQDYIRTAWAKGLRERVIILKHTLKNSLIPVVTLAGMGLSQILGGSVLIEYVFNIAGIGRLAVDAVFSLDYTIIQAIVLITAMMVVTVNLLVDISYGWLDPRIRYA
jgi:peptide/nickel transport system permease protein